jgi:magnesium transporter
MADKMRQTLESLARAFAQTHPEGAAHALERLEADDAAEVLATLPSAVVGPVAERLAPHAAGAILSQLGPARTSELLEAMTPRQAADVLQHLEEAHREAALGGLAPELGRRLRDLVRYPPETAGGIMEPQVTSLPLDLTAEEAVGLMRKAPLQTLYYLYVTDRERRLVGVLSMRDLLIADPRTPIASIIRTTVTTVPATMDREEVATLVRQRDLLALPVVDDDGRLLGVVKHDQVLDALQEEAFEDMQKMVGAGGDESALSPVGTVLARRLPWLMVNLLTAFAASAVIALFEGILAKVTALAVLLPIVSGQGGNSGAQALAVVVRGLALREIIPGTARWLLMKETLAGLLNGVAVAVVTGAVVLAWSLGTGMTWRQGNALALVIALAMVANMVVAPLSGAAIPLLLRALGRDPAQSSTIFLTTITDVVGFASFLGLAVVFGGWLA